MLVFLIFSIISIVLFFYIRNLEFLEHAKFFTMYWMVQIVMISFVFIGAYDFTGLGFLYIVVASIVFIFSSTIGKALTFHLKEIPQEKKLDLKRANIILIAITALAFLYPFIKIARYGFGIQFLLNITSLLEMNNAIATDRYNGTEINTTSDQILLVFTYLSPLFAGYVSTFAKKHKWLYYLVFVPTLLVAITQTMKLGFITSVFFWIAGKITAYKVEKLEFPKLTPKRLAGIGMILLLFMGLLFFSMLLRTDDISIETVNIIKYKFLNYAFGHLVGFDEWFSLNWDTYYPNELKTFYGISNILGIGQRVQGVFEEFLDYSNDKFPGEMITNVYTFFRFLIEDFGPFMSLIFFFILGLLSGSVYELIRKNRSNSLIITVFTALYALIMLSFATSIFAYTSYILVFVLYYGLLTVSLRKIKNIQS